MPGKETLKDVDQRWIPFRRIALNRAMRAGNDTVERLGFPNRISEHRRKIVSEHVYKSIELTGSSTAGIEDAVQNAIRKASQSLRNLKWFQILETRGHVEGGEVAHWQVTLKVGFTLED